MVLKFALLASNHPQDKSAAIINNLTKFDFMQESITLFMRGLHHSKVKNHALYDLANSKPLETGKTLSIETGTGRLCILPYT